MMRKQGDERDYIDAICFQPPERRLDLRELTSDGDQATRHDRC